MEGNIFGACIKVSLREVIEDAKTVGDLTQIKAGSRLNPDAGNG